jgi:hypothetical protein
MANLFKILEAWETANNPTETEVKIAHLRAEICDTCPSKVEIIKNKSWSYVCGECGCPLSKKIYTQYNRQCPLGKWSELDSIYFP